MKRTFLVCILSFSLILILAIVSAADFYVIPVKKRNYAPIASTGQTKCWSAGNFEIACSGSGQDGEYQMGVAWPNPRFTDNGDGTVTDNLTGLTWMKNAYCFGSRNWFESLSDCNGLADGSCGLTDGSSAGDWRLPNIKQLSGLIHFGFQNLSLPNTAGTGKWSEGDPFTDVQTFYYYSSTTHAGAVNTAWTVYFGTGFMNIYLKGNSGAGWCVRGSY